MTNYTKITDFAAKDALLTGNPAKLVKGLEINNELIAIQTAISSKADSTSVVDLTIPSGSSLVGYLPSGTGAVASTVQAKLREYPSVNDYGSNNVPGSTDMTAAVQACFLANAGGEIEIIGTVLITSTCVIPDGTTLRFKGRNASIKYTGSGNALEIRNSKNVSLYDLNIDISSAGASAVGLAVYGCWWLNIYKPIVLCNGASQSGIRIQTSSVGGNNFGAYMIEIYNPEVFGTASKGIETLTTPGDVVSVTHINVYGGWVKNSTYGLYIRNCAGGKITGFVCDTATDCINVDISSDIVFNPGELGPATGYAFNWGPTCSAMVLIAPNNAGSVPTLGYQNNTSYTPNYWQQGSFRSYASRSDQNYYSEIRSIYSAGGSFELNVNGGSGANTLLSYDAATGTHLGGTGLTLRQGGIDVAQVIRPAAVKTFAPMASLGSYLGSAALPWGGTFTGNCTLTFAAQPAAAGNIALGSTTATTVGAAGGAAALPATPLGYMIANVAGTQVKIPYYTA